MSALSAILHCICVHICVCLLSSHAGHGRQPLSIKAKIFSSPSLPPFLLPTGQKEFQGSEYAPPPSTLPFTCHMGSFVGLRIGTQYQVVSKVHLSNNTCNWFFLFANQEKKTVSILLTASHCKHSSATTTVVGKAALFV